MNAVIRKFIGAQHGCAEFGALKSANLGNEFSKWKRRPYRPLMNLQLAALAALICFARLASAGPTPDETARFLAGLPMHGTALEEAARNAAWVRHAMEFDDAWRPLDTRQLVHIRTWAAQFLVPDYGDRGNVFYFFSGPDFLYAQTFFPNASNYVLCGLEPIGALPDVTKLPHPTLEFALANLRKAMNSVLSFSFFITKDMKTDLTQTQLSGTLPVLLVFLARTGCKVDAVEPIDIDKSGAIAEKAATHGVKIVFFGPGGHRQTLYYFTADLSDDGVKSNPAILKFSESLGRGHSLLKAASYLMHTGGFEKTRDFILTHSDLIVQDDSGIPFHYFDPARWTVRLFGNYQAPIDIFKQHAQPALFEAFQKSVPPDLTFSFGYRWHPRESCLILARPK